VTFFKRKPQRPEPPTRKRLQRLSASEVYDWSEALLIHTGRGFGDWRRGGGAAALDETEKQLQALLEVCAELRARESLRT
jgi:hypothetical protein